MAQEQICLLDFGSQYTQLIARLVRNSGVYCGVYAYDSFASKADLPPNTKGIILSGSPHSVHEAHAPDIPPALYELDLPLLGICYGAQRIAQHYGGKVAQSKGREYGLAHLRSVSKGAQLGLPLTSGDAVWMSHADTIVRLPKGFSTIAQTEHGICAAFEARQLKRFGLQFHPEVSHTTKGKPLLVHFLRHICRCTTHWTPAQWIPECIQQLTKQIGKDEVIMAVSGGVDSSLAAHMIQQAIGGRLHAFFVNTGLLRKGEYESVLAAYKAAHFEVEGLPRQTQFYAALRQKTEPEAKRKAIGGAFVSVFEEVASRYPRARWLGQGTIYSDVIESAAVGHATHVIKSHHNVGGLPAHMRLGLVEPLRTLFKDEVRQLAQEVGLGDLVNRHPFPGPGLAIRILGEVTAEKVAILQEADAYFMDALRQEGHYDKVWQAGALLLPARSVGVMGDHRQYGATVVLRAVQSQDGMTANWAPLPHAFLDQVARQIVNQIQDINRVVYDITSKPPATIEWE